VKIAKVVSQCRVQVRWCKMGAVFEAKNEIPGKCHGGMSECRRKCGNIDSAGMANWGDPLQGQHFLFVGDSEPAARASAHIILPPPKVEPQHDVFAEAMLEDNPAHRRRNRLDWFVSLAIHAVILSLLLFLPIFYTTGLDVQKLNLTFLAPPVTPLAAPPPPPLTSSIAPRAARSAPIRAYVPGKLTVPIFIAKTVVNTPGEIVPPDEPLMGEAGGVPGGVPGGIPGGQMEGAIGGVLGGVMKNGPMPLPAPPAAGGPKKPVRVGGEVKQPRLLYGPEPVYPVLARQARVTGTVIIEAVIDEHGNVTGMRVVKGDPLLIPAALAAVSKRKYEPTILDGEPTPLDLKVEINFHLP
jgi:periplasmic protein TonB